MYRVCVYWTVLVLVAGAAMAQGGAGRSLSLTAGDHVSLGVPVSIPLDVAVPEGATIEVTQRSGEQYPATLRNGELTFIADGAMPGASHRFQVGLTANVRPPTVRVERRQGEKALDVVIDGKPFTTYHYANDGIAAIEAIDQQLAQEGLSDERKAELQAQRARHAKKPYLWPVYSEGGINITRNWPMGELDPGEKADHPHHKSIWTAYGDVNGVDTWGEGGNSGYQFTDEVDFGSGHAYGWIAAKNTWHSKDKQPVITERREYRFYAGHERARLFDASITFTADYGDAKFGDTKEGGIMAFRIRDRITVEKGGAITLATGAEKPWGQASAWSDYSGMFEGMGERGIAVFDHPDNLRHPTRWHIRDYGLNGANCFGLSYFVGKDQSGDFTLKAGESITFKYRVYVHAGDAEFSKVADRYADYVTPPKLAWSVPPTSRPRRQ